MIKVENLHKYFGDLEVLKGVNAKIDKSEVVCVIGPSGSGKSTFLRCLNLLEVPTAGKIYIDGIELMEHQKEIDKYRQKVGMVFQQFNLFENMTVLKNCVIGQMKVLKRPKKEATENAIEFLDKVGMGAFCDAKPRQRQRPLAARQPADINAVHNVIQQVQHLRHQHGQRCFQDVLCNAAVLKVDLPHGEWFILSVFTIPVSSIA